MAKFNGSYGKYGVKGVVDRRCRRLHGLTEMMRVLRSIILPPTKLMVLLDAEVASSSAIRPQVVSDQSIRSETIFLQQLSHKLHCGMLVPLRLDELPPDFLDTDLSNRRQS